MGRRRHKRKGELGTTYYSRIEGFYIEILIWMAIKNKIPHIQLHWSKFIDIFCTHIIANCMTRFKFKAVLKCIHLIETSQF